MKKHFLLYALSAFISLGTIVACTVGNVSPIANVAALTANTISLKKQIDKVDLQQFKLQLPEKDYQYVERVYHHSLLVYVSLNKISKVFEQPNDILVDTSSLFSSINLLRQSYFDAYQALSPNINQYPPDIAFKIRRLNTTAVSLDRQYQQLITLGDSSDISPVLKEVLSTVKLGLTLMSVV